MIEHLSRNNTVYHRPPVPDHKQPPVVSITTKYYNLLIALDQGFVLGFIKICFPHFEFGKMSAMYFPDLRVRGSLLQRTFYGCGDYEINFVTNYLEEQIITFIVLNILNWHIT